MQPRLRLIARHNIVTGGKLVVNLDPGLAKALFKRCTGMGSRDLAGRTLPHMVEWRRVFKVADDGTFHLSNIRERVVFRYNDAGLHGKKLVTANTRIADNDAAREHRPRRRQAKSCCEKGRKNGSLPVRLR